MSPEIDPDDRIEIRSPFRPFPLGAKQALADAATTVEYDDDDPRVSYVDSAPDEAVLDEWELKRVTHDAPTEVWVSERDERIEIYDDRVLVDGRESTISSEEAKTTVREQERFTRIDTVGAEAHPLQGWV